MQCSVSKNIIQTSCSNIILMLRLNAALKEESSPHQVTRTTLTLLNLTLVIWRWSYKSNFCHQVTNQKLSAIVMEKPNKEAKVQIELTLPPKQETKPEPKPDPPEQTVISCQVNPVATAAAAANSKSTISWFHHRFTFSKLSSGKKSLADQTFWLRWSTEVKESLASLIFSLA